jgi:hypothetical protein
MNPPPAASISRRPDRPGDKDCAELANGCAVELRIICHFTCAPTITFSVSLPGL